jgi:hypothetical protein
MEASAVWSEGTRSASTDTVWFELAGESVMLMDRGASAATVTVTVDAAKFAAVVVRV